MATVDEINRPKRLLIKNEQKDFWRSNEINTELANNLSLFLDKNGLLRVKGRLQNSSLPRKTKFSILLNKNSSLTVQYLEEVGWLVCSNDLEGYAEWSYVSW